MGLSTGSGAKIKRHDAGSGDKSFATGLNILLPAATPSTINKPMSNGTVVFVIVAFITL
jgi:hypothetical protein